jgi:hypothetical protein
VKPIGSPPVVCFILIGLVWNDYDIPQCDFVVVLNPKQYLCSTLTKKLIKIYKSSETKPYEICPRIKLNELFLNFKFDTCVKDFTNQYQFKIRRVLFCGYPKIWLGIPSTN